MRVVGCAERAGHTDKDVVAVSDLFCGSSCDIVLGERRISVLSGCAGCRSGRIRHDVKILSERIKIKPGCPGRSSFIDAHHPVCGETGAVDIRHIDLGLIGLRFACEHAVVFDHYDRLLLGFQSIRVCFLAENDRISIGAVVIRLLEHLKVHHYINVIVSRFCEDLIGFFLADAVSKYMITLRNRTDAAVAAVAAEDIHAALKSERNTFRL